MMHRHRRTDRVEAGHCSSVRASPTARRAAVNEPVIAIFANAAALPAGAHALVLSFVGVRRAGAWSP